MSDEGLDLKSRVTEANRRSLFFDDSDDEPLVFKRTKFHYKYGKDEKTKEFGEDDFGEGEEEEEVREEEFGAEDEFGEGEEMEEVGEEEELGAEDELGEEEESYCVENDPEMISASSSNKRIKDMPIDRLSALPDSLLIHILSFLDMQEAVITSVLSKRWQFLWTDLPRFKFWEGSSQTEKIRKFVAWVHRTLVICSGYHLEKFEVEFMYDKCFASDVNVWVEFAVKNKVKEVALLLNSCKDLYTLPQMMYSNSSLTWLSVRGCIMGPRRTIEWRSLTTLYLEDLELHQHVIEKILSGCPVLYSLILTACWGLNCLEVNSQSLYALTVEDWEDGNSEPSLEISAPHIHYLEIWNYPKGRQLRLTNIAFVVTANIDFKDFGWDANSVEVMSYTKELFENLQHVQELELGPQCIELLSTLAVNGWQLPQSRLEDLIVNASRDEQSISGIVGLLESSPNLETLVIKSYDHHGASVTWVPTARGDLDCDLLHLKTVNITNFADPNLDGEPMLTLAQILLKRATTLEKMVIDVEEFTKFSSRHASSKFIKIAQTLLSYPRSSTKAVVLLS